MTSTVSFKDKLKQIFSVILWDLKGCKGSLMVYTILASVFTVIIFTLVFVLTADQTSFSSLFSTESSPKISLSEKMQVFQVISSAVIGFLTLIFAIIYTVQIFSYMHNKRKVDFYGSLPISRARLFLAKYGAAYLFSIVPMLVFMGIIAIASICTGTLLLPQVTNMYVNFIVGTLACISAYGFLSACCGTTFNTVIMFIAVCACYPLSMVFVRAYIDAFFTGAYTQTFSKSFITNALNPISAYFGNNLIYWLVFSAACIAFGTLLIMKRRSERAQTSFAYYIPCHIIKVIVSFLTGMFLGTMFGSLNVFGNGVGGFVFGFILASAPTFLIVHMIFYKGLKQIVRTIPIYAGLAVVVIVGVALINLDVFGYNTYVPKSEDVKSAGIILTQHYYPKDKNFSRVMSKSAEDFTSSSDIDSIVKIHNNIINSKSTKLKSVGKFKTVWGFMLYNAFDDLSYDDVYAITYKLNNGRKVNRFYSASMISLVNSMNTVYSNEYYYDDYGSFDTDGINKIANPLISSKTYVTKYSALMNSKANSELGAKYAEVTAMVKGSDYAAESCINGQKSYFSNSEDEDYESNKVILNELNEALKKDFEADDRYLNGVLYDPFGIIVDNSYKYEYYDGYSYSSSEEISPSEEIGSLPQIKQQFSNDFVCKLKIEYKLGEKGFFDLTHSQCEYYYIPKTYTNTLEVLKKYGLINSDYTINKNSQFYNSYNYEY
uniref:ABC transporter permease n=1 Tax=uncultured Ruminococcus sp. TaxID=165186 RepID=UPI0025DB4057|nr:ABC transporter permease [uncultured Ruminococcus sp.]